MVMLTQLRQIGCLFFGGVFTIVLGNTNAFIPQERCVSVACWKCSGAMSLKEHHDHSLSARRRPTTILSLRSICLILPKQQQQRRFDRTILLVLRQSIRSNVSKCVSPSVVEEPAVPTTLRHALRVFFGSIYHGPRTILASLVGLVSYRGMLGTTVSVMEVGIAFSMVLFWCVQEHVLHQRLLHSDKDWQGKRIHQKHHSRDYFHISIDPAPLMIAWMSIVGMGLLYLLPSTELAVTGTVVYASAGLWYEWTHYIVHTKVRFPKNSYFDRCKTHHACHHLVNSNYWLAFSYPSIDDWFGTNPSVGTARRNAMEHARSE